jgi:ribosomal protein S18 acetylase RimI-like enzyme
MTVEVRRAQSEADFGRLYELLIEYEAALAPELRHGCVSGPERLKRAYVKENAAFLAASEGHDIGCLAVKRLDRATAVMQRLFVKPQHRGMGAARALVEAALAFLRNRRYTRVVLDTDKAQLNAAYRLYRSLGFEECAPYGAVSYGCPTFMERYLRDERSGRADDRI